MDVHRVGDEIVMLPYSLEVPGFGFLPMNAFLVRGSEPVLIDTGLPAESEDWLETLWSLVEPDELRWIFLTHEDRDHSGKLEQVMEAAPNARLVLNYLCMAKLVPEEGVALPPERIFLVNPGQSVEAGDRRFSVVKPPLYDSGATIGFVDEKSATLFGADSFGAIVPSAVMELSDLPVDDFAPGFAAFNMINSPWVSKVDRDLFAATIREFSRMELERIMSVHSPAAQGMTDTLLDLLEAVPGMEPVELPDDAGFRASLAELKRDNPMH